MKRVLVVTYFWPPSGKASVHWPLKMVKYLPGLGWLPSVLTVEADTFSQPDQSLLSEIDPALQVLRTPSWEPFALYRRFIGKDPAQPLVASEAISKERKDLRHRISIWLRMNLFVPDARVGWYWPAVRKALRVYSKTSFDAIVSVGPPQTGHLIAKTLSKRFGIPHIPVLIDPWVDVVYYRDFKRSRLTLACDRAMERSVMSHARKVVFVTRTMKEEYEQRYPFLAEKSHVLYWGYDEQDFASVAMQPPEQGVVVHAGNMFDYQNPLPLWNALKDRISRGESTTVRFIGTVGPGVRETIARLGLSDRTEYLGFLPYREMLEQLSRASYLLVCVTEERHVPGKLFEYLRMGRPILAFGGNNSEVRRILEESGAGRLYRYDEDVRGFFETAQPGVRDVEGIRQYDRKQIAGELADILNGMVSG